MRKLIYKTVVAALICVGYIFSLGAQTAIAEEFKDVEIRVIRPRFFPKRKRFEIGAQLSIVMNQTFIYSYLATGILTFHLTESWALEASGSFGLSIDKSDKSLLKSKYNISTLILRNQLDVGGALVWTPIYGKYQLSSGRLVYFDTFVSAGAGLAGIEYTYDHCEDPSTVSDGSIPVPPTANTVNYLALNVGIGQRFFLSKNASLRWDLKGRFFQYDTKDGACNRDTPPPDEAVSESKLHTVVIMQLGASYFL